MQAPGYPWLAPALAFAFLVGGLAPCRATPLSEQATVRDTVEGGSLRRLTDAEIVGGNYPRTEDESLGNAGPADSVQRYLEGGSGEPGSPWLPDRNSSFQHGPQTGSPLDVFRSLVNVPKGTPRSAAQRPSGAHEIDVLGVDAREWIDDTVRGIVNSAIETRINDQGRTTFSVLGMGDFSVVVSGDRGEAALVSGDDVLLTAQRTPYPGAAGNLPELQGTHGGPIGGGITVGSGTSIQHAVEMMQEVATHPLSVLVYTIFGAFALLWKMMGSAARRPATRIPVPDHAEMPPPPHRSRRRRVRRPHRVRASG